jgi:anti-sigma regulatory factor (Ser/Thr protein kinase)
VAAAFLTIPSSVEHVRTARLVAVAAARRAGLGEEALDDVRLAVGEVVARAVSRHAAAGVASDVDLVLHDGEGAFAVEVVERSSASAPDPDDGVSLALVRALVPDVRVSGPAVTLRWHHARPAAR